MSVPRWFLGFGVWLLVGSAAVPAEPKRVLLLGQKPDGHPAGTHEYMAGQKIVAQCLARVPSIKCTIIQADDPWSDGPELLDQADAVVLFVSEGARWISGDPARLEAFQRLAKRRGGLVVLHWGMGTRETGPIEPFLKLFGACHGGPDRKHRVFDQAELRVANRRHPITRGIDNLTIREELYYRLKMVAPAEQLTPIIQVPIEDRLETVAWAWDRPDGGRSFGFSGLHFHENWKLDAVRRLVAQSVLWTLDLPVSNSGLTVEIP